MNQSNDPVQVVVDEIERLQRELAAAHEESAKRGSEILNLQQENAELRRDAERYRWLRNSSWEVRRYYHTMLQSASVGNLDQAIDAALKEAT